MGNLPPLCVFTEYCQHLRAPHFDSALGEKGAVVGAGVGCVALRKIDAINQKKKAETVEVRPLRCGQ